MERKPEKKRRWKKPKVSFRVPASARVMALVRRPKSMLVFVVLCLFFVAMNWAIQQAAWDPVVGVTSAVPTPTPAPQAPEETKPVVAAPKGDSQAVVPEADEEAPSEASEVSTNRKDERTGWHFFHPTWRETPDLDLVGRPKLHPNFWTISDHKLDRIVGDPNGRVDSEFAVTSDLRDRVLFWMRIHTQYNSYMRVLHDRNNPSIIYGIVDFSELFRESHTDATAMNKVYRFEKQIQKELKARLSEAAGLTKTALLTPWERGELRALLSKAGALGTYEAANAIGSIRSQTGQRDEFMMALSRSEELLPYIEATFRSFDLPIALARIPFVESSFNPRAYSKVGATGIFQFMPFTARQMISPTRPELWSDPLLQTRAAARMLIIFRSMLPDWTTTVTAYNSGVGRLQRLSRKYHAKTIGPLLEMRDPTGLGFAGKNFYAQFLSVNLAEAYRREIFPLRKRDEEEVMLAFERPRGFNRRFRALN